MVFVAPHPDDEAIACPATLLGLQDAGFRIDVLTCSLGRPEQESRRRAELLDAARRADFGILVPSPLINLSDRHDLAALEQAVEATVLSTCLDQEPVLVVAPHPHDAHPAHELVGRAVARALRSLPRPPPLWLWSIWADLAVPTLYSPFGQATMDRALVILTAHEGEVARNDYRRLLHGRAIANTVIGSERVFGFGSGLATPLPYADVLTELAYVRGVWRGGVPREFAPSTLSRPSHVDDLSWLFDRPSYTGERCLFA